MRKELPYKNDLEEYLKIRVEFQSLKNAIEMKIQSAINIAIKKAVELSNNQTTLQIENLRVELESKIIQMQVDFEKKFLELENNLKEIKGYFQKNS